MKDQKVILHKCLKNDWPAFVISGTDACALAAIEAYYSIAKEKGCSPAFLEDMKLVIEEIKHFQEVESDLVKLPD